MEKKTLIIEYLKKLSKSVNSSCVPYYPISYGKMKLAAFSSYIAKVAIWYINDRDNEFPSIFVVMDIIEEEHFALDKLRMIKEEIHILRSELSNL